MTQAIGGSSTSPTSSAPGAVIPQVPGFQFLECLGVGANATVYKARQLTLDRYVAIKVLNRRAGSDPIFVRKLLSEGRAAAKINHPNVVQAFDVGMVGDVLYFVMEFIDGQTVQQRLLQEKRLAVPEALAIVTEVAKALQQAHRVGMVHCDVKPHNIMLTARGDVKLADLGLVRQTSGGANPGASPSAGRPFGTPFYISPEQVRGEVQVDGRSDIYSLGATFYHMTTGRLPYEGDNAALIMRQHLTARLTPPDQACKEVPAGVSAVIEMMMMREPAERYQNVEQLLEDLAALASTGTPLHAQRDINLAAIEALEHQRIEAARAPQQVAPSAVAKLLQNPLVWILAASLVLNFLLLLFILLRG